MNEPTEQGEHLRAEDEPGLRGAAVYDSKADDGATSTGVNTYDRPATTTRSGPNLLAILILLLILALLAYAAFQVLH